MIRDLDLISSLDTTFTLPNITLADGSTSRDGGIGIVNATSSSSLPIIIYVLSFLFNLLFVS